MTMDFASVSGQAGYVLVPPTGSPSSGHLALEAQAVLPKRGDDAHTVPVRQTRIRGERIKPSAHGMCWFREKEKQL